MKEEEVEVIGNDKVEKKKENKKKCQCNEKNLKEEKDKNHKCHKEEVKKLEEKLKQVEQEKEQLLNKIQLAQAELINYRKRKEEETENLLKYANQDLIIEIINVVDNFERAIKLDDNDLTDELSKFLTGFKMIYATLTDILRKFGVEEIMRVGEIFDPNQEEALMTDSLDDHEEDEVLEVLLKGYKLKDRVIRPASVKVNKK